jgi:DNA-binding GntR family transcriptional regulator
MPTVDIHKRTQLSEDGCYNHLLSAIVSGTFQPNQRLIEIELAQSLGVGRATVRTALARLEQEGVVERERHRGARVRFISESEAVEILEARTALECLVARHAAQNASVEDVTILRGMLDEMRVARERGDLLGVSDVNGHLHRRLVKIAQHATASRLLDLLHSHHVRFQFRTILAPGRSEQSFAEHCAIVEAVAAHDPDDAEAAMRRHLSHVTEALRQTQPDRIARIGGRGLE